MGTASSTPEPAAHFGNFSWNWDIANLDLRSSSRGAWRFHAHCHARSRSRSLAVARRPFAGEVRITVAGDTVRKVLDEVFVQYPILRGYVVDEQGLCVTMSWRSSTTSRSATNNRLRNSCHRTAKSTFFKRCPEVDPWPTHSWCPRQKGCSHSSAIQAPGISATPRFWERRSVSPPDHRDGSWYAAMNLGHFGVKLKYSPDRGKSWEDRAAPAYPEGETFASFDGKARSRRR